MMLDFFCRSPALSEVSEVSEVSPSLGDRFGAVLLGAAAATGEGAGPLVAAWQRGLSSPELSSESFGEPSDDCAPATRALLGLPRILLEIDRPGTLPLAAQATDSEYDRALAAYLAGQAPQPRGIVAEWLRERPPLGRLAEWARSLPEGALLLAVYCVATSEVRSLGGWRWGVERSARLGWPGLAGLVGALVGAAGGQAAIPGAARAALAPELEREILALGEDLLARWAGCRPGRSLSAAVVGRAGGVQPRDRLQTP